MDDIQPTTQPTVREIAARVRAGEMTPEESVRAALDRIAADRADDYRLVLATASNRMYAAAIADELGFDDVVATNSIIGLDERVHMSGNIVEDD